MRELFEGCNPVLLNNLPKRFIEFTCRQEGGHHEGDRNSRNKEPDVVVDFFESSRHFHYVCPMMQNTKHVID
jgi:hypothetical protein